MAKYQRNGMASAAKTGENLIEKRISERRRILDVVFISVGEKHSARVTTVSKASDIVAAYMACNISSSIT